MVLVYPGVHGCCLECTVAASLILVMQPPQNVLEATAILATSLRTLVVIADVGVVCSFPSEDRAEKGVLVLRTFSSGCFPRNEDIVCKNKVLLQQLS